MAALPFANSAQIFKVESYGCTVRALSTINVDVIRSPALTAVQQPTLEKRLEGAPSTMPHLKKSAVSPVAQPTRESPVGAAALPPGSGLVYVSDDMPGLSRLKTAKGIAYRDAKGKAIIDTDEVQRINKLAIPPAYERVWICAKPNGHLQATGYDARGRKQYRYHADWQSRRNESKFDRLEAFGQTLPRIRARVTRDLVPHKNQPLSRTLVLATLVRLLDTTFVRVGNDAYARENGSYGLTTLRTPHAGVRGSTLRLRFRGKSGVMQDLKVDDPKVASVVRRCQQLPGQLLFQYEDEAGELHGVGSSDVNDYLAEIAQGKTPANDNHFTAKDFRTWHGTAQALELTRLACKGAEAAGYNAKEILSKVARQLGNTPAVCKKSYIHPAVMALGSELTSNPGTMIEVWDKLSKGGTARRLQAAEARLMAFLKAHQRQKTKLAAGVRAKTKAKTTTKTKAKEKIESSGHNSVKQALTPVGKARAKNASRAAIELKPSALFNKKAAVKSMEVSDLAIDPQLAAIQTAPASASQSAAS